MQSELADFQQCMKNLIFLSQRQDSGLARAKFLLYENERKICVGVESGARAPSKLGLLISSASSRTAAQMILLIMMMMMIIVK